MIRHFVTPLLILLCLSLLGDARQAKGRIPRDSSDRSCLTNAECLQKGLPLISPRDPQQRIRRQNGQAFVPVSTTTCGTSETVFLPVGQYQVGLRGSRGAGNGRVPDFASAGGRGAVITATFDVASNITVGYFIGCIGSSITTVGGGGGGSFVYLIGPSQPAILVAGGGGGGGYTAGANGQPAGINFDGRARNQDGTAGVSGGAGGPGGPGVNGGGGGGGFVSPGQGVSRQDYASTGGSQSTNYGGTFAGGTTFDFESETTGGAGSGGGAGFYGGGGGGGWSGGGGGAGDDVSGTGGGGGGTYANTGVPGGITVSQLTSIAASEGMGALTITKV